MTQYVEIYTKEVLHRSDSLTEAHEAHIARVQETNFSHKIRLMGVNARNKLPDDSNIITGGLILSINEFGTKEQFFYARYDAQKN